MLREWTLLPAEESSLGSLVRMITILILALEELQ
jgi:hypothetical protein